MQPFRRIVTRTSITTPYKIPTPRPNSIIRATAPAVQQHRTMSSSNLNIENTNIKTASGVELSSEQKTIVGSVLDLFAGRPSLEKLKLWADDAVFEDPITVAKGRAQYAPQWYGLQVAFSQIERLHHEVTSSGNPIEMDLKTRYVIKGIGKEQTIASKVNIYLDSAGKISKVEDKWDGKLPESGIANVSGVIDLVNPFWWAKYAEGWAFWTWSWVWYTWPWMAFRRLNANSVPWIVSVPKNAEEDAKRGNPAS